MKKAVIFIGLMVILFLFVVQPSRAQQHEKGGIGVGFQFTWPAYGLSGMYDITDQVSLQAVIGPFGNLNTFAARGLYRFKEDEFWNLYGYGMLGLWAYKFIQTESAVGFGAGAGIEVNWQVLSESLPPISWNWEIGFGIVGLESYNFSTFMIGGGLHYRF